MGQFNEEAVTDFEASGYACRIILNEAFGTYCGYVGVNPDHPLYAVDLGDDLLYGLHVHGGITFAGHMPELGNAHWYLGFDCLHGGDKFHDNLPPEVHKKLEAHLLGLFGPDHGKADPSYRLKQVFRDKAYVRDQILKLVEQLDEIARHARGLNEDSPISKYCRPGAARD